MNGNNCFAEPLSRLFSSTKNSRVGGCQPQFISLRRLRLEAPVTWEMDCCFVTTHRCPLCSIFNACCISSSSITLSLFRSANWNMRPLARSGTSDSWSFPSVFLSSAFIISRPATGHRIGGVLAAKTGGSRLLGRRPAPCRVLVNRGSWEFAVGTL